MDYRRSLIMLVYFLSALFLYVLSSSASTYLVANEWENLLYIYFFLLIRCWLFYDCE